MRAFVLEEIPWYCKMNWILFNIAASTSLFSDLLHWGLLEQYYSTGSSKPLFWQRHILNVVLMIAEAFAVAFPVRVLHFVYPMLFCSVYMIWAWIQRTAQVKSEEHSFLNQELSFGLFMLINCLSFLFILPCHYVFYLIHRFKIYLNNKKQRSSRLPPNQASYKLPKIAITRPER